MKLSNALAALALLGCSAAGAADPARVNAALALFDAMNMKIALEQTIEQSAMAEIDKNPALLPFRGVFLAFLGKHMGYDTIKHDLAALYADAFTEQELMQLTLFYTTPVGKKAMEKLPALTVAAGKLGERKVMENATELQSMIAEEARRIQSLQSK